MRMLYMRSKYLTAVAIVANVQTHLTSMVTQTPATRFGNITHQQSSCCSSITLGIAHYVDNDDVSVWVAVRSVTHGERLL